MMPRGSGIVSLVVGVAAALAGGLADAEARPGSTTIRGEVVEAHGRWTADRRTILTEAVVRTPAGDVEVLQLGGHAEGHTMVVLHGAAQLTPGQRVILTVHPSTARSSGARPRWLVQAAELVGGGGAQPWVRTPTNRSKQPVYWAKGCVQIARAREGTTAIPGDGEATVIQQSLAAWNAATASCSYLDLVDLGAVDSEVGHDGVNLIKFRDAT